MPDALPPYPTYKDSGVPWLGRIPAHWRQIPGRACYREKKVSNTGLKETTVLSLSYGQIVVKPPEKLHGLVPASFETYQIVDPGDIIVRPTDLQNDWNSLRFGLNRHRGIITSAYMCFHTEDVMTREYGHLLLHAYDLKKVFYGLGSGLRQNLDWRDFKYLPCLVPPPDEQQTITRYLDHVDRRIRRYIRAKQKLIALLEEQKQAIIHQAVTRGLDPSVRLKPSGVAWLGEVPEHWGTRPAKYFFREVDDRSSTGEEELLSVSHITGVTPRSQKNITMFMAASYVGHKRCQPGDLVINTMWAWMGALGIAKHTGLVSPSYGVYRPLHNSMLLGEYADLLLRTKSYVDEYICRSTGIRSSRLRLYPEQFLRIHIVCPSTEEQRSIHDHIASEAENLNLAIERTQREIALLREYRTRLLADVVTGQVDVRAAPMGLADEGEAVEELEEIETLEDDEEAMAGQPEEEA
jgi:type I restriction enzyme S subunit